MRQSQRPYLLKMGHVVLVLIKRAVFVLHLHGDDRAALLVLRDSRRGLEREATGQEPGDAEFVSEETTAKLCTWISAT